MMMGNMMGAPGFGMLLIMAVLLVMPFWRLLPKFGFNSWFSLFAVIPLGAVVLLWVLAFNDPKPEVAQ